MPMFRAQAQQAICHRERRYVITLYEHMICSLWCTPPVYVISIHTLAFHSFMLIIIILLIMLLCVIVFNLLLIVAVKFTMWIARSADAKASPTTPFMSLQKVTDRNLQPSKKLSHKTVIHTYDLWYRSSICYCRCMPCLQTHTYNIYTLLVCAVTQWAMLEPHSTAADTNSRHAHLTESHTYIGWISELDNLRHYLCIRCDTCVQCMPVTIHVHKGCVMYFLLTFGALFLWL